jgi:hypothetical protein
VGKTRLALDNRWSFRITDYYQVSDPQDVSEVRKKRNRTHSAYLSSQLEHPFNVTRLQVESISALGVLGQLSDCVWVEVPPGKGIADE